MRCPVWKPKVQTPALGYWCDLGLNWGWEPRLRRRGRGGGVVPRQTWRGRGLGPCSQLLPSGIRPIPLALMQRTWARMLGGGGCDVGNQEGPFPAGSPGVSGAGCCGSPRTVPGCLGSRRCKSLIRLLGVRVTPPTGSSERVGSYLASRREGPVHVKQAEDALLPAGALSGDGHGCSSRSPAETKAGAAGAARDRGQDRRGGA